MSCCPRLPEFPVSRDEAAAVVDGLDLEELADVCEEADRRTAQERLVRVVAERRRSAPGPGPFTQAFMTGATRAK
jgi:hypothetical protein